MAENEMLWRLFCLFMVSLLLLGCCGCGDNGSDAAQLWRLTGSLNDARDAHTATLLPDGMILVAGGQGRQQMSPT